MVRSVLDPNKVFINEYGIIEINVIGNQTPGSVELMGDAAKKFLENNEKKLILDDVTQLGEAGKEVRQKVVEYGKILQYDKLALLGTSGLLQLGSNLMLQAIGKGKSIKYFTDRDKAIEWLLAKK
jgi:hypothetical protein